MKINDDFLNLRKDIFPFQMTDVHTKAVRSYNMSQIKGKDTKPEMLIRKYTYLLFFYFLSVKLWAQKTPEELGSRVFNIFKSKDYAAIDTLTPSPSAIVSILRNKDPHETITKDSSFKGKYIIHDKLLKDKCKKFIDDTIEFNIDWQNASLKEVKYYVLGLKQKSDGLTKPVLINYLDIYFISNQETFLIQFRSIYSYNDIWKLGENVRFQKVKKNN